jgi:hypothetical protein
VKRKFLILPWAKESPPVEVKEIDWRQDNREALFILLNTAHLNFTAVPKGVSYYLLFQLAVLIGEYQFIKLVSPWIRYWIVNERTSG